jgi:GNAT superfamily N-acetyltransferase
VRPIKPGDAPGLLDFHKKLSDESLYFRFLTVTKLDPGKATYSTHVDYEDQFALVGETTEGIVAVGHFYRDPTHPHRAEVAFAIADALQGLGVATALLERLAAIAREKGITTFEADVLPANNKTLDVFANSGYEITQRVGGGSRPSRALASADDPRCNEGRRTAPAGRGRLDSALLRTARLRVLLADPGVDSLIVIYTRRSCPIR